MSGIAFDLIFGSKVTAAELEEKLQGTPAQLFPLGVRAPAGPARAPDPAPFSAAQAVRAPAAEPPLAAPRKPAKKRTRAPKASAPPPSAPEPELDVPVGRAPRRCARSSPWRPPRWRARACPCAPCPRTRPGARGWRANRPRSLTQTVRVDIRRLDALMNTVGELLLIKANLQRMSEAVRQEGSVAVLSSKMWGQELSRETRQLERKLDALQQGLLEVRMVPVGQVFDKLARLVRRISRELGKEIDFVITGGEVELDKLIVEELSDPLMHIIRNAIDHGVESPEVRQSMGKPRRARWRCAPSRRATTSSSR